MKKTLITALLTACSLLAAPAFAADACEKQADDKKLAGAAKTSFLKKCEKDAMGGAAPASAACEKVGCRQKLAGAAKNSHLKKCMAGEKTSKS